MNAENIFWYGHDAFRIDDNGKQIYIDPWKMPVDALKADYIFITHSHYDHYSVKDIRSLSDNSTKIIGPQDVASREGRSAIALSPNQKKDLDQLNIVAVPAYNINKQFHPKANNWIGFIITLSDGVSIYHAGDTDFIPEMRSLKVDIALLPVSGTFVMTAEEAIEAANSFNPHIAIPMHFGDIVGDQSDAERFKAGFTGTTIIKQPI